jgi:hypothetical protein
LLGAAHAPAAGKLRVLQQSPEYGLVGACEPFPECRHAGLADPAFRGVRWLSADDLLGDPTVSVIAVESHVAPNLRLGKSARVHSFPRHDGSCDDTLADNTHVVFEYERRLAHLSVSQLESLNKPRRRWEIMGSNGTVILPPLEPPGVQLGLQEVRGGSTGRLANGGCRLDAARRARPGRPRRLRARRAPIRLHVPA